MSRTPVYFLITGDSPTQSQRTFDATTIAKTACIRFFRALKFSETRVTCRIRSKSSAVKIGSEIRYDMANLSFVNMTIVASHRGIAIQARDSGISNFSLLRFKYCERGLRVYEVAFFMARSAPSIDSGRRSERRVQPRGLGVLRAHSLPQS